MAKINAVFQTIDLISMSLGPLSAGLIFGLVSSSAAAYFIAAWNVVSVIIEYWLLKRIYNEFPMLSIKKIFEKGNKQERSKNFSKVTRDFNFEAFQILKGFKFSTLEH